MLLHLPSVRNQRFHARAGAYIFVFVSALGQKRIEVVVLPKLTPNQIDKSVHEWRIKLSSQRLA